MPQTKSIRRTFVGREFIADPRDRFFAAAVGRTTGRKMWNEGPEWFDQDAASCCVGAAWFHWLSGSPVMGQYLDPNGIYRLAQYLDEWEGEAYEGTSVRAGAKVLAMLGFIERYEWAFSVDAIVTAVLTKGPVVVGTDWYEGMNDPDVREEWLAEGRVLGGHAWLITGVDTRREAFRCRNSHKGNARGWLPIEDMATLLASEGEACLAIERKGRLRRTPK